jgi:hypothetical protein
MVSSFLTLWQPTLEIKKYFLRSSFAKWAFSAGFNFSPHYVQTKEFQKGLIQGLLRSFFQLSNELFQRFPRFNQITIMLAGFQACHYDI